jgi:hypothetical protein
MLITCASCRRRISNKHPACPHCNYDFKGSGEGLPLERARTRIKRDFDGLLRSQGYLAMLTAIGGGAWYYWQTGSLALNFRDPPLSLYVFGAGVAWYFVVRIWGLARTFKG